jgi:hypothetical protein
LDCNGVKAFSGSLAETLERLHQEEQLSDNPARGREYATELPSSPIAVSELLEQRCA